MNLRNRFARFMSGRYGIDAFSKMLLYTSIILYVINIFTYSDVLSMIAMLMLVYCYFRMFSRNVYKRALENQSYLEKTQKIRAKKDKFLRNLKSRKTHHIYKCPNCKQKIRIPKGKGRINIRCTKCGTEFIKKS